MRLFSFVGAVCCAGLLGLTGGCFRPAGNITVEPLDHEEFRVMRTVLRPQLERRGILDADGAWYSPLVSLTALGWGDARNAGEVLLQRLSPAFRFPGTDPSRLPASFQAMLSEDAEVTVSSTAFSVSQGLDRIGVSLIAEADWNRDGRKDWLVLCRIEPQGTPGGRRDYYLAVTDFSRPVLTPEVIAIRDCVGGRCEIVATAADPGLVPDLPVMEMLQGQQIVTRPPRPEADAAGRDGSDRRPGSTRDLGSGLTREVLSQ